VPKSKAKNQKAPAAAATAVEQDKSKVKKRVKRDKDAPKKPMAPFFCYQSIRRPQLKLEQPDLKNTEIIRVMAGEWNQLSFDEKLPHLQKTEEQKQRYDVEMKAYKQKKAVAEAAEKAKEQAAAIKDKKSAQVTGKKRPASKKD